MSSAETIPVRSRTAGRLSRLNRDSAPHLAACLSSLGRVAFDTRLSRLLAWWWDVELGAGCRFFGLPIFHRHPRSVIRIGANCQFRSARWANLAGINRPCIISTLGSHASIEIGEGCGFSGTAVASVERIVFGRRVMCGANVSVSDTDWHPVDPEARAAGQPAGGKPVWIGDDVWLGMNSIVLKGVTIGARTVVGAGSIVSRSLPGGVIAAGQPARVIRELPGA